MGSITLEDIEVFYSRYGPAVLYRCRQLLRSEDAAWDAMHQTFVKAINYRDSFRGESGPLTWLYAIAFRVCMDSLRQARVVVDPKVSALRQSWEEVQPSFVDRLQQQELVAFLLPQFSREVQELVAYRFFDELSVKEICSRTGISERTIARRLEEFFERARVLLKDRGS